MMLLVLCYVAAFGSVAEARSVLGVSATFQNDQVRKIPRYRFRFNPDTLSEPQIRSTATEKMVDTKFSKYNSTDVNKIGSLFPDILIESNDQNDVQSTKNNNADSVKVIDSPPPSILNEARDQHGVHFFSRDFLKNLGLASHNTGTKDRKRGIDTVQNFKGTGLNSPGRADGLKRYEQNNSELSMIMQKIETLTNLLESLENMHDEEVQTYRKLILAKDMSDRELRHSQDTQLAYEHSTKCDGCLTKHLQPSFDFQTVLHKLKQSLINYNSVGHRSMASQTVKSLDTKRKGMEYIFREPNPSSKGHEEVGVNSEKNGDDIFEVTKKFRRPGDKHEKMMRKVYHNYLDRVEKMKIVYQLLFDMEIMKKKRAGSSSRLPGLGD